MLYWIVTSLIAPFPVLMLLALAGWANLWRRRREGRRRLLLAGLPLVGLMAWCTPAVAYLAMGSLEWQIPGAGSPGAEEDVEAIVVLGGYLIPPDAEAGRPRALLGPDTLYRCFHAAEAYRRVGPCPVVVSGGKVDPSEPGPTLAGAMREFLITQGVDPDDLIAEGRSRSTHENAVECARILRGRGLGPVLLVTEAAHMPRALACFDKQGVRAAPSACMRRASSFEPEVSAFLPGPSASLDGQQVLHEWLGLAWYRLRGRI